MASELRRWLQRHPHPTTVVAFDVEGDELGTVELDPKARSRWRDCESAVASWPCARLEARNGAGSVLRAFALDIEPSAVPQVAKTQSDQLVQLAKLLHDAHDAGAKRHEEAYARGFEQITVLVKVMSERLAGLEKAWHRLLMSLGKDAENPVSQGEGLLENIIAMAAAQKLNGMVPTQVESESEDAS